VIFRVKFKVSYFNVWKDFNNLFDAANYAAEINGTVYDDDNVKPIRNLRIEFVMDEEPENNSAPTSAD